jgi:imidazolonepropionase-like amidohydrolase
VSLAHQFARRCRWPSTAGQRNNAPSATTRACIFAIVVLLCVDLRADEQYPLPRYLAIVGATVVNPERDGSEAIRPDSTVVIDGSRILEVGPVSSTRIPKDAQLVDGAGKWLIPGLVDSHIHFFQSGNLYTRPDAVDLTALAPYAAEVARNKARLSATFKVWIASGVTTVVDVGGPMWNFEVRQAARGQQAAPYVAVAGPLISTVSDPKLALDDPPIMEATSVQEAIASVARQAPSKPDYIKVWFIRRPGQALAEKEAIVQAVGAAAHRAGLPLAVHATELSTAKAALRAGADYLVHSVEDEPVDAEFIALLKKNAALYCPTLWVHAGYSSMFSGVWRATEAERRLADPQVLSSMGDLAHIAKDALPPWLVSRMSAATPPATPGTMLRNLKTIHDAGVAVVMGTDAGNIGTLHGPSVFREMALMQEAGLTPLQVLRAATVTGARAAHREKSAGTIAPGKTADLVLLRADPTLDVNNLTQIERVFKSGRPFDPDQLIASIR